jgi:hypothetical protein
VLASQSTLIANRSSLKRRPEALSVARQLLEFIVAHLRATENVSIFANMRGDSAESIAQRMFTQVVIGGLQGPTLSPVITRQTLVRRQPDRRCTSRAGSPSCQVGGSGWSSCRSLISSKKISNTRT